MMSVCKTEHQRIWAEIYYESVKKYGWMFFRYNLTIHEKNIK